VRPDDAEARLVQAQVLAHLGRWSEAHAAVQTAKEIDPDRPELPGLEAALAEVITPGSVLSPATGAISDALGTPASSVPPRQRRNPRWRGTKRPKKGQLGRSRRSSRR
jgi:hypothetical protein